MPRPSLFAEYRDNMTNFLTHTTGIDKSVVSKWVEDIVKNDMQSPLLTHVYHPSYGNHVIKTEPLWKFTKHHNDKTFTGSGSVYRSQHEKTPAASQFVTSKLKERKVHKTAMLKAKDLGDKLTQMIEHYAQATIKINVNSLPGAFGSAYNIWYDKGGYNSITSLARTLIANAYVTAEQLLGGNFYFQNIEELINHIVINTREGQPGCKEIIEPLMKKYNLKPIHPNQLFAYYESVIRPYDHKCDLKRVRVLLNSLNCFQVYYLYYLCNLRHLVWGNEGIFKPWIDQFFGLVNQQYDTSTIDPQTLYSFDEDLIIMVNVMVTSMLDGCQIYNSPTQKPDVAKRIVCICHAMKEMLESIQPLFDVFINTPIGPSRINMKKNMTRNTTIISDTDSVIYTSKDWVEWYTGTYEKTTDQAYQIASLVIYWLSKATTHALYRYSIQHGAIEEYSHTMAMKNEYLYPSLILYDIKKTYAGIISIQEGVVSKEPDPDIKGGNLRSSKICREAADFVHNFIVDDILKPSMNNRLSAMELIGKVVFFEHKLIDGLKKANLEYLKVESINTPDGYKQPMSSPYFYWMAWQEIFSETYGNIEIPSKVPLVQLKKMNKIRLAQIKESNPTFYAKLKSFIDKHGKFPNYIPLHPEDPKMPPELESLIDVREIVYANVRPIYITLEQLGISIGFEKQKLLLSDIYNLNEVPINTTATPVENEALPA